MSPNLSGAIPYGGPIYVESYSALESGPSNWVVDGLIPAGGISLLYGAPKTGKSMLALQLALAVVKGEDFLTYTTPAPGRVLYLQLDTPRSLWRMRINHWQHEGVDFGPWGTLAFEDKESAPYPFNILDPRHADWLRSAVDTVAPTLVVLDVWKEAFRGNENEASVAQEALSGFSAAVSPAALLIISHGKKPPSDSAVEYGLTDEIRGSSYLPGAVDTIMRLRCKENSKFGKFAAQGRALEYNAINLVRGRAGLWSVGTADE